MSNNLLKPRVISWLLLFLMRKSKLETLLWHGGRRRAFRHAKGTKSAFFFLQEVAKRNSSAQGIYKQDFM